MPSGDSTARVRLFMRVGAAGAFRQRVGADHLARGQLGQVLLLLLFGAEEDQGQGADAGVRAHGDDEAAALGHVVGDDGGRDLVHLGAAVLGGNVGVGQAHFGGLLEQVARDLPVLVLDLFDGREEFVDRKLVGELGDHLLVFVEVFRSEDGFQVVVFEQKASARKFRLGSYRCCGHPEPRSVELQNRFHHGDTEVTEKNS